MFVLSVNRCWVSAVVHLLIISGWLGAGGVQLVGRCATGKDPGGRRRVVVVAMSLTTGFRLFFQDVVPTDWPLSCLFACQVDMTMHFHDRWQCFRVARRCVGYDATPIFAASAGVHSFGSLEMVIEAESWMCFDKSVSCRGCRRRQRLARPRLWSDSDRAILFFVSP